MQKAGVVTALFSKSRNVVVVSTALLVAGCSLGPEDDPDAADDACPVGTARAITRTQLINMIDLGKHRTCKPCEPGTYCAGLDTRSVPCSEATFDHDADPATACVKKTACAPGEFVSKRGSVLEDRTCSPCAAGTYSHEDNARACTACTGGSYCPPGSTGAQTCAKGFWDHDMDPKTPCEARAACPPGSTDIAEGDPLAPTTCVVCPAGTYDDGKRNCVTDRGCAPGTVMTAPGTTTSPMKCAPCAAGEYCPGGETARTTCAEGTWDDDGQPSTSCVAWSTCGRGQYVDSANASTTRDQCSVCPQGTYSTTLMASACAPQKTCEPGTYVRMTASAASERSCGACPAGTSSTTANATTCGRVRALDAEGSRTCALMDDGSVRCWGGSAEASTPVAVPGLVGATAIAIGRSHACALNADGTVACWGSGAAYQLGDGQTATRESPALVPNVRDVRAIAASEDATYALRGDGSVVTWGTYADRVPRVVYTDCYYGSCGASYVYDPPVVRATPVVIPRLFGASSIVSDGGFVCAAQGDQVRCLEGRDYTQGGDEVAGLVLPGLDCAVAGDGTATCWNTDTPTSSLTDVTAHDRSATHRCFVTREKVACAGTNGSGELGDGTTRARTTPVYASGLDGVVSVATGLDHTCALRADGSVFCWGANDLGQIGDGTSIYRLTPVRVEGLQ